MSERSYIGSELELFLHARNWKNYYGAIFRPFLRGRVLEVGAGLGETTVVLCDGTQTSWLCLEPDLRLSGTIQKKIAAGILPAQCKAQTGYTDELPADARFDTILYVDVLEHIREDRLELITATKHLASGGVVIALSPAHQWLFSEFDSAIGHFRRYTKKTLLGAAPPELQVIQCRYLDSVGIFASIANKCILRQSMPTRANIDLWDQIMVPLARRLDPVLGYRFGKSVIAIWRLNEGAQCGN